MNHQPTKSFFGLILFTLVSGSAASVVQAQYNLPSTAMPGAIQRHQLELQRIEREERQARQQLARQEHEALDPPVKVLPVDESRISGVLKTPEGDTYILGPSVEVAD